ncbi:glycosyltransferase family 4 protein [Arthrobacter sp. C9C5]|uniref:glycosyltransferase family 4 protein n=1 Tax=Arthrobacter sp. C9C5 TaxID=2735267 RepID=UPI001584604B|nr:glycosyltransferase family 4 protein [Arthrobacter sp. C9C5]NUU33217.1 glycosyltransferase [Arthrobacter sp. C9C5]
MTQLFRNIRLAAGVAGTHLSDDPFLLLLQLSRRLPARLVGPLAAGVTRLAPGDSAAIAVLLASLVQGDAAEVERRLLLASAAAGEPARRLADVALAAQLPDLADDFLGRAEGAPGLEGARARRFWYDGAVSDAVAVLARDGRARRGQRARLAAELSVLNGAAPVLDRVDYTAVPGRVLHLLTNSLPHTSSGYAQRSHSILAAQQAAGWDVQAVTRLGYPVQVGKILAKPLDVVDGVRYRRLLPAQLAATMDARLQQQAAELLDVVLEFRPSMLHTTTHFVNALVVRAVAQAVGIPWVYEVRGQLADTWASTRGPAAKQSERYRLFQQREAEVMRNADLVVTLGGAMKANIVAAGIPGGKVLIAPNAVGGDFLAEPLDTASARRALGLNEAGQYIGTVSSLVAYEGLDCLIEAFVLLAPRLPDLKLLIVGDGVSRPALEVQARQSGYGDRIIFTGRVPRDQAVRYHQALDVFVVPRKDLAVTQSVTPLKPVEALACARPVVASKLPALAEIVEDGVTGRLATADDPVALSEAVRELLSNPELAERMGAAGRSRVLRERTWAANVAALAAELGKLGVTI